MLHSRLNPLLIAVGCLAMLSFSVFVAGCGDDDDDDDVMTSVVNPPPTTRPPTDTTPPDDVEDIPDPPAEEEGISFKNDIEPILDANCAVPGCHTGNGPTGGLNLETYANFEKGGDSGRVFVPGKSRSSLIIKRISPGGGMPNGRPTLPKEVRELVEDWIDEGAKDN